jgi:hypothetical protein
MAFTFNLETTDGTPADPPSFQTVAPIWRPGDPIRLGTARHSVSSASAPPALTRRRC